MKRRKVFACICLKTLRRVFMAANQTPEMKQNEPGLRKQLSPMHVWAIAFGCVIGWGSFINPGKKFLPNSGVAGTAIAMVMGALVMMIIAFSYAYMVPKYPKAGGEFTCTKNAPRLHQSRVLGRQRSASSPRFQQGF